MRAKRIDGNHRTLVEAARQVGAEVLDLHALPGALDVLIGYRGTLYLVEIKDGAKPPSARTVTDAERGTIERFQRVECPVHVVTSVDDLLRVIGAL